MREKDEVRLKFNFDEEMMRENKTGQLWAPLTAFHRSTTQQIITGLKFPSLGPGLLLHVNETEALQPRSCRCPMQIPIRAR